MTDVFQVGLSSQDGGPGVGQSSPGRAPKACRDSLGKAFPPFTLMTLGQGWGTHIADQEADVSQPCSWQRQAGTQSGSSDTKPQALWPSGLLTLSLTHDWTHSLLGSGPWPDGVRQPGALCQNVMGLSSRPAGVTGTSSFPVAGCCPRGPRALLPPSPGLCTTEGI